MTGDKMVVSMHYTMMDERGTVLDSSQNTEPLAYLHRVGNIIPSLEKALIGKVADDDLKVMVEPADGYGEVVLELM